MRRVRLKFELNTILLQSFVGWPSLSRQTFRMSDGKDYAVFVYDHKGARESGDTAKPITTRGANYLQLIRKHIAEDKEIPQDEWVIKYLPSLQKTMHVIMEIPQVLPPVIPDTTTHEFAQRLITATNKLKEIQNKVRDGKWDEVVKACRGVYEDLTKAIPFNQIARELISKDTGIPEKNLNDLAILVAKSSDYDEAIHHYRTSEGEEINIMVHKEDAYFSYLRLLGLVNMLCAKITKQLRGA